MKVSLDCRLWQWYTCFRVFLTWIDDVKCFFFTKGRILCSPTHPWLYQVVYLATLQISVLIVCCFLSLCFVCFKPNYSSFHLHWYLFGLHIEFPWTAAECKFDTWNQSHIYLICHGGKRSKQAIAGHETAHQMFNYLWVYENDYAKIGCNS